MGVGEFAFELWALEAGIRGVFAQSCCGCGDLLCREDNAGVFTGDWALF